MSSGGSSARWWENYLVRYFMPSIGGAALVRWLSCIGGDDFAELLGLPGAEVKLDSAALILLFLYGNLWAYVASTPILVLHGIRVAEFGPVKGRSPGDGHFLKAIAACAVLALAASALPGLLGVVCSFIVAVVFIAYQLLRSRQEAAYPEEKTSNRAFRFARSLARRRACLSKPDAGEAPQAHWREELVETYRHLREHGNAGFIFVLELVLSATVFRTIASDIATPEQRVALVGILLGMWCLPALGVYQLAQTLERQFLDVED